MPALTARSWCSSSGLLNSLKLNSILFSRPRSKQNCTTKLPTRLVRITLSIYGAASSASASSPLVDVVSYSCQHWFYVVFVFFFKGPGTACCSRRRGHVFLLLKANYVVGCVVYCFHPRSGGSGFIFNFFLKGIGPFPSPV